MGVVLDFAYGISEKETLLNDFELSSEVISLPHRFEVKKFTSVAAAVACSQATVETSVRLYQIFRMYE